MAACQSWRKISGPPIQASDADAIRLLEAQVRECFGRVIYTHKTHSKWPIGAPLRYGGSRSPKLQGRFASPAAMAFGQP